MQFARVLVEMKRIRGFLLSSGEIKIRKLLSNQSYMKRKSGIALSAQYLGIEMIRAEE